MPDSAVRAGAIGYVTKNQMATHVLAAILAVETEPVT